MINVTPYKEIDSNGFWIKIWLFLFSTSYKIELFSNVNLNVHSRPF